MNIGHSSKLQYDPQAYSDKLAESVGPLQYRIEPNSVYNCQGCLSTFGPRSSYNGYGVSTTVGHKIAPRQEMVDVESVLSNRNVKASRTRAGEINHVDVLRFKLQHPTICNSYLDPESSRLEYPAATYRDMGINRFYDLNKDPQANIFYDFATNTSLEEKDNYRPALSKVMLDKSLPQEFKGEPNVCRYACTDNGCGKSTANCR
jgi:hypothetical protein